MNGRNGVVVGVAALVVGQGSLGNGFDRRNADMAAMRFGVADGGLKGVQGDAGVAGAVGRQRVEGPPDRPVTNSGPIRGRRR